MSVLYGWNAIAVACSMAGALLLRWSWRKTTTKKPYILLLSWILVLSAIPLWSQHLGYEYAVVYCALSTSLCAWVMVASNLQWRTNQTNASPRTKAASATQPKTYQFILFLASGPIAGISALGLAIVSAQLLPFSAANQWVSAAFMLLLFWAILTTWLCSGGSLVRKISFLLATIGLSAFILQG